MRIHLHIGPDAATAERVQRVFDAARDRLTAQGIRYAQAPGARNHTRLFMAVSDPDSPDSLRFHRGFGDAPSQAALRADLLKDLADEVATHAPRHLVLCAAQLGTGLHNRNDLLRLRDLLADLSDEITVHLHLDDPARLLARRYGAQVLEGRIRPLSLEQSLLERPDFAAAARATWPTPQPHRSLFAEAQGAGFWLDLPTLAASWADVFGADALRCHTLDPGALFGPQGARVALAALGIEGDPGEAGAEPLPEEPSAVWLARARMMNDVLLRYAAKQGAPIPRALWRKLLVEIKRPGPPIAPGSLHRVSARFAEGLAALATAHPAVDPARLRPDTPAGDWREPDPELGFRATQYLMAFRWRIDAAMKDERDKAALSAALQPVDGAQPVDRLLSPGAQAALPDSAKQVFLRLRRSAYAPHNRLGMVDEEALAAPFSAAQSRMDATRRVIVACMKNEAPYVLEWIAHHRALGFDAFLVYTNDCDDGTDALLDRLQALGLVQHRDNGAWKGRSPQQHALDLSLKEPMLRQADWIAHIDVDEFVNIRCGNGTLDDLFARIGDATNVAMTWRLFGHNGVTRLDDRLVIEQFDRAAPRHVPKPHTAWGFKTLFRNIGAYGKLSCHRPNRLDAEKAGQVRWVNGSGQDMTDEVLRNGWRNSRKSIGYDLVQLNHYALRSAESFLIKRQRGRALHVDRSIGLNYWIRMDWSYARDITIQRNIPRVAAERARLLEDPVLRALHDEGLAWHRAKAAELHANPEFAALRDQALALDLTEMERVAYALALDMDS
ncbi:glycosyltransferase family 2 protein [Thetidibacter halocola]|uniref:Glycosyltransferase family 2 protein n=1 Tax=Thetidibacter halocola TaxID=2827239 RepID=A0A8J7WAE0_9RHOB|nr:glycosyltransferase family 2 protein [Thetidibacter halocola]MBS0122879.1 glycosyltransferase family 2 protein [Thetidibacter halocola]